MKKYYIEINGQQSEALSFDDLRNKHITKDTLIWFEGLADWSKAGSIAELDGFFTSVPPSLHKPIPPPLKQEDLQQEKQSFLSNRTNRILLGAFSFIVFAVLIYSFSDKTQADTQQETRQNTLLIQEQQRQLDEQNVKIAEQERIEKDRVKKEQREAKEKRINELNQQITIVYQNIEDAKKSLNAATAFQILRSSSERNRDINNANETLSIWQNELETLQNELKNLNPEYN